MVTGFETGALLMNHYCNYIFCHGAHKNIQHKKMSPHTSRKILMLLSLHSHNSKAQMENARRCQDRMVIKATTQVSGWRMRIHNRSVSRIQRWYGIYIWLTTHFSCFMMNRAKLNLLATTITKKEQEKRWMISLHWLRRYIRASMGIDIKKQQGIGTNPKTREWWWVVMKIDKAKLAI